MSWGTIYTSVNGPGDNLPAGDSTGNDKARGGKTKKKEDKVYWYAHRLLSLGCLYLEYSDAIREGDHL